MDPTDNNINDGATRSAVAMLPADDGTELRRVSWRRWLLGGVLTAAVIACIFSVQVEVEGFLNVITRVELRWIPLSILVKIIFRFVMSVKWWFLLRARDIRVRLISVSLLQFSSYFIGRIFPGALGIDLVRTYVLAREEKKTALIVASVLMDRITNMVALAVVSLAALALLDIELVLKRTLMGVAGAICLGFVTMMLVSRPLDAQLSGWEIGSHSRMRRALDALRRGVASLNRYNAQPLVLLRAILWGLLVQALRCMEIYILFVALGHPEVFLACFALVPLFVFAILVPLGISGVAVGAGAMVILFEMVGVPSEVSFTVAVLANVGGLVLLPFGALCYWLRGRSMLGFRSPPAEP